MANYISVENQKALAHSYRAGVRFVLITGLSLLVLLLIARFITPSTPFPGSEKLIRPIFMAALVLGLIAVTLRRLLMSQSMMAKVAPRGVNALLGRLLTTTLICLAIAVLVGIKGFTFYLLTGDYENSLRLGLISLLLVFYSLPRRGEWERIITRNTQ
jgi:TRAP-type C4-dicarboxylate transport system permease small subunit